MSLSLRDAIERVQAGSKVEVCQDGSSWFPFDQNTYYRLDTLLKATFRVTPKPIPRVYEIAKDVFGRSDVKPKPEWRSIQLAERAVREALHELVVIFTREEAAGMVGGSPRQVEQIAQAVADRYCSPEVPWHKRKYERAVTEHDHQAVEGEVYERLGKLLLVKKAEPHGGTVTTEYVDGTTRTWGPYLCNTGTLMKEVRPPQ